MTGIRIFLTRGYLLNFIIVSAISIAMRIFVIDAFNLIHAIPEIRESARPHVDFLRLIRERRLAGSSNNRVVIVFDGYPVSDVGGEREYEIVFAKNESADDVIRKYVAKSKHPRQITVVSDDRAVRNEARASGADTMKNTEFLGTKASSKREPSKTKNHGSDPDSLAAITRELEEIWVKKR
jgi:predicted RNA-binding protein with PIN domain